MPELDFVVWNGCLQVRDDLIWLGAINQRFKIIARHGDRHPVNVDHFNHAPSGRNGRQPADFPGIAQCDFVGIGVIGIDVTDVDADFDSSTLQVFFGLGQAFIVGFPTQETPKQPHVRTLAFMGSGQGTIWVKFDEYVLDVFVHQVAA